MEGARTGSKGGIASMRTSIVTSSIADPVVSRLSEVLQSLPSTEAIDVTSYDRAKGWASEKIDLMVVCLNGNQDKGLAIVREARRAFEGKLLAVGPVIDPKFI